MKNRDFVHLHVHCQTSLLDGMGSAESYAKRAKEIGFEYLALTDHGDISGTLKWQKACENEDIVPVLGTEIYVCKDATDKKEKPRHLTVLTKNQTGWQNLLRLTTHAHNNFIKRPRADYDSVLKYSDGLIFMSACINSIMKDDDGEAFFCEQLSKKAPVFIEIMPHDHPLQKEWNKTCTEISRFYDIPMVASNDAHYVLEEDSESQEVLLAIQRGAKWNDPNRWKFDFKRLHLKTADEMIFDFEKIKIPRSVYLPAMRRTLDVARMCGDFRIEKKPVHLPLPPGISGDEFKFLENLCVQGYYDKIGSLIEPEYDQRISYELDIIQRKGFVRYFLIVWDLIRFCRLQNMTPSPGRGSVGCSLVAFLLGITKVDPVLYHLPFSRFINEERLDSPDIDLDFPDNKRDSVFKYLKETYGENNVAGISTFLRMQARLVIRDVSRVFDVDLKEVDSFAKTIEKSVQEGIDFEIEKKTKEESFHLKYPDVIKHALKLEGQVRGYSRHAAGAAISYEPLSDGRQAYLAERGETTVVGWDMSDCEYVGLLKLDILGLKFLTVLGYAKELIQQNHDVKLDFDKIPLDDSRVYKELSNGNFTGIFQMGWAIQDVVRRAGVANIREWSDAIALGRPGPLDSGQTDEYIRRKHGAEWTKKHPIYEEVTRQTYGVEVFQETTMNVFHKVAGLPYATADKIRKVIGKKRDPKEFEPYHDMFLEGCRKQQTLSDKEVEVFWDGLLKCARYQFNKSHSLAYAILGYWTLYTKVYYPAEYMAAFLTHGSDKYQDEMVKNARAIGLQLVPPKIGISDATRWQAKSNKLYLPFSAIDGIGEKTALEIAAGGRKRKTKKKKGFLGEKEEMYFTPSVKTTLDNIMAFDPEAPLPKSALHYFSKISMSADYRETHPSLLNLLGRRSQSIELVEQAVRGELEMNLCRLQDKFRLNPELQKCRKCSLRQECSRPVNPSPSDHNMMIIGQDPGKNEDRLGVGFVGNAGDVLWEELKRYDLTRDMFHVTNTNKCFPSKSKKSSTEQIETCREWLDEEIRFVNPYIILVLGSNAMYFFTGQDKGITQRNATIEWNEGYSCYLSFCLHPSSTLHSPKNKGEFQRGIEFFSKKIELIGGI
jgi:DNA polymerase III subunit alpha